MMSEDSDYTSDVNFPLQSSDPHGSTLLPPGRGGAPGGSGREGGSTEGQYAPPLPYHHPHHGHDYQDGDSLERDDDPRSRSVHRGGHSGAGPDRDR